MTEMNRVSGDLLRRGINENDIPLQQVLAYLENYEEYMRMENPFIGDDE